MISLLLDDEDEKEKEFIRAIRDLKNSGAKSPKQSNSQRPHHLAIFEETNQWLISPSLLPPSWRVFMTQYYSRMFYVGLILLRGFALALGIYRSSHNDRYDIDIALSKLDS